MAHYFYIKFGASLIPLFRLDKIVSRIKELSKLEKMEDSCLKKNKMIK